MATDGSSEAIRWPSFTAAEDPALARVWMSTTESVADMRCDIYWERAAVAYRTQPEAVIQRTGHSLSSRWGVLQRLVQKYLAADELFRSAIPSEEVEVDTQENVMLLFMTNNQVTTKKGQRNPVLKSVYAAHLFCSCPKCSATIRGPSKPDRRLAASHACGGGGSSGGSTAETGGPGTRGHSNGEGEGSER